MKVISVNPFDVASIESAINKLTAYRDSLGGKLEKTREKLAERGREVAEAGYSAQLAMYPHEGASMPSVSSSAQGVVASGHDVGFLEFGTGCANREWDGSGHGVKYTPPAHGTYGSHHGLNPGWWYYGGRRDYGMMPAEAMLMARDEIIARTPDVAREVFADG